MYPYQKWLVWWRTHFLGRSIGHMPAQNQARMYIYIYIFVHISHSIIHCSFSFTLPAFRSYVRVWEDDGDDDITARTLNGGGALWYTTRFSLCVRCHCMSSDV